MKKFICVFISILFACSVFAGCKTDKTAGTDTNLPEPSAVVASIGDEKVTYAAYTSAFNSFLSYMGQYGYNPISSRKDLEQFQDWVFDMLVADIVTLHHAKQDKFELTEEQKADIKSQADSELVQVHDECMTYAQQQFEKDDSKTVDEHFDEYVKSMSEFYTGIPMDFEGYSEFYTNELIRSKTIEAYMHLIAEDFVVSDEEITEWYQEQLELDEKNYSDNPQNYKHDAESFETAFGKEEDAQVYPPTFIPEGYSRIMNITIYPSGEINDVYKEKSEKKQELQDECSNLMFSDAFNETNENAEKIAELLEEYREISAECDRLYDEYTAEAREKAEAAYAELEKGRPFAEVMLEYTEDPAVIGKNGEDGCEAFKTKGQIISLVHSSAKDDWTQTVKDVFSTLSVGEYSLAFTDEDGSYHIIFYASDEKTGPVGLDALHDTIKKVIKAETDKSAWEELIETWKDDTALKIDMELVRLIGADKLPPESGKSDGSSDKDEKEP